VARSKWRRAIARDLVPAARRRRLPTNYVPERGECARPRTADHEWLGDSCQLSLWHRGMANRAVSGLRRRQNRGEHGRQRDHHLRNSAARKGSRTSKSSRRIRSSMTTCPGQIALTNTGAQSIEFGDVGLAVALQRGTGFKNKRRDLRDTHASITRSRATITSFHHDSAAERRRTVPADGAGCHTGAGFEYMDNWVKSGTRERLGGRRWDARWPNGLDVFYIHSNQIKKTNRATCRTRA